MLQNILIIFSVYNGNRFNQPNYLSMKTIMTFLFPKPLSESAVSVLLLLFRIAFGLLIMYHGISKISHFDTIVEHFPNPLGIGSHLSLILVIFAEVFCAAAFLIGLFYRLCMIPMLFSFAVIVFIVSHGAPFAQRELPAVYLITLLLLYIAGPGKLSIDYLISKKQRGNE